MGFLDAAARKALDAQRFTFFRTIQLHKALEPVEKVGSAAQRATAYRVKESISNSAEALIEKHSDALPDDCARAPSHLATVALAIAAQRELLLEASGEQYMLANANKVRTVVAGGLGVFAPPTGEPPYAVPAMWIPNRLSVIFSGGIFFPARKHALLERMLGNFEADLGKAFTLEHVEPAPTRRMTKCFYTECVPASRRFVSTFICPNLAAKFYLRPLKPGQASRFSAARCL
eukprot:374854-Pleurochrysis_carterae.AAC.2